MSEQIGGDGGRPFLHIQDGVFRDVAGNLNNLLSDIPLFCHPDLQNPSVANVTISLSKGILIILFSESIRHEIEFVDLAKMHISNVAQHKNITLIGATYSTFFNELKIDMTESQRVSAIKMSGTRGGDGLAAVFDLDNGAVVDYSYNKINEARGIVIHEAADDLRPRVTNASLNFSDGLLSIRSTETVVPSSVILSLIHISNVSQSNDVQLSRSDRLEESFQYFKNVLASVVLKEGIEFKILLSEIQRQNILEFSNVGNLADGSGSVLDVGERAYKDVAFNDNAASTGIPIFEFPDQIPPKLMYAYLNFSTGELILYGSEFIDSNSLPMNLTLLQIRNRSDTTGPYFDLKVAASKPSRSIKQIVTLTESQRVVAFKMSSKVGGDSSPTILAVYPSAFVDTSNVKNTQTQYLTIEEFDDVVSPKVINVSLNLGTGILSLTYTEFIDLTPSSLVSLQKMKVFNTNIDGPDVLLLSSSATLLTKDDSISVQMRLTEISRAKTVRWSGTPGGDSTAVKFSKAAGASQDLSGNPDNSVINYIVHEIPDTIAPLAVNASINLNDGTVTLISSEILDQTVTNDLLISMFNESFESDSFSVHPAFLIVKMDSLELDFRISEELRRKAILISSTPGGDGLAGKIRVSPGALADVAGNPTLQNITISLQEIADTTKPVVQSASIFYGHGMVEVAMSEIIKLTPVSSVNLNRIFVSELVHGDTNNIPHQCSAECTRTLSTECLNCRNKYDFDIGEATVVNDADNRTLQIQLTESQRIRLIRMSDTQGGDASKIKMAFEPMAIVDIGLNPNIYFQSITVTEYGDFIRPYLESVSLNLSTGILRLLMSETIPYGTVEKSKIHLGSEYGQTGFSLGGARLIVQESKTITIVLQESQRVAALKQSGTKGGDGTTSVATIDQGFCKDVATNLNIPKSYATVIEYNDTVLPEVISISVNFSTGLVVFNHSETVDATPKSNFNLERFIVANDDVRDPEFTLSGSFINEKDGVQVSVTLTEALRVKILRYSTQIFGGDGTKFIIKSMPNAILDIGQNGNEQKNEILIEEHPDVILPAILNATLDLSKGVLVIQASETIDSNPASNTDVARLVVNLTDANVLDNMLPLNGATPLRSENTTFTIVLTEEQRVTIIQKSGTNGGDGSPTSLTAQSGFAIDMSGNKNIHSRNIEVFEIADSIPPQFVAATLNYSNGDLVIRFTEFIDSTPKGRINLSSIILCNDSLADGFSLFGAHFVDEFDNYNVRVILNEDQRTRAVLNSNTYPGDNSPLKIAIYSGALFDVANNEVIKLSSTPIAEVSDVKKPVISKAHLNFTHGILRIEFNESMDLSSDLKINLKELYVLDIANQIEEKRNLYGAKVVHGYATLEVVITLTEKQRVTAIASAGVPGGDGSSLFLGSVDGVFVDISNNPQIGNLSVPISESPDIKAPKIVNATIDYATGKVVLFYSESIIGYRTNLDLLAFANNSGFPILPFSGCSFNKNISIMQEFLLTETQRVNAQYLSHYFDGSPTLVYAAFNAFQDVGLVPNANESGDNISRTN